MPKQQERFGKYPQRKPDPLRQHCLQLGFSFPNQFDPLSLPKDGPWEPETIAVPTGQLRLCLESYIGSSIKEFADQEGCPLESQLNSIFACSYRFVVRCRERTRIQVQEERQRALERSRREEPLRQQREAARRIEEEKARRAALMESAADWQRANLIRQYVAYVVSIKPDAECAAVVDWEEWSLKVADELDPTTGSSLAAISSPVVAPDAGRSE